MVKKITYRVKLLKPDLEMGEVFCDCCDGIGIVKDKKGPGSYHCSKCRGAGKLDWVENVVGKGSYGSVYKYDRKAKRVKRVD